MKVFFSIIFIFVSLPAHAFLLDTAPRVEKAMAVEGHSGNLVVIERLFKPGSIPPSDPILQLRNDNGAIIARGPIGWVVVVFCPEISRCWAFSYQKYSVVASVWKVDYENLEYDKELADDLSESKSKLRVLRNLKDYLQIDGANSVRSRANPRIYGFEYTESGLLDDYGMVQSNIFMVMISPLAIMIACWAGLLCHFLATIVLSGFLILAARRMRNHFIQKRPVSTLVLSVCILMLLGTLFLIGAILVTFQQAPIPYALLSFCLGSLVAYRIVTAASRRNLMTYIKRTSLR